MWLRADDRGQAPGRPNVAPAPTATTPAAAAPAAAPTATAQKEPKYKIIVFDVDGTLSPKGIGCDEKIGPITKDDKDKLEDFIASLEKLKKQGTKLYIVTRCRPELNIYLNLDYYEDIKAAVGQENIFGATDTVGGDLPTNPRGVDGGVFWAEAKSYFMLKIMEKHGITERSKVLLIDDDKRNTETAEYYGFHSITSGKHLDSKSLGGMTNHAIKDLNEGGFKNSNDMYTFMDGSDGDVSETPVGRSLLEVYKKHIYRRVNETHHSLPAMTQHKEDATLTQKITLTINII